MKNQQTFFRALLMLILIVGLVIPILAAETKGIVVNVYPEKNEFVVTENIRNLTLQVTPSTKLMINNREAKLFEMMPGDEATVVYEKQGPNLIASMVRCSRKIPLREQVTVPSRISP